MKALITILLLVSWALAVKASSGDEVLERFPSGFSRRAERLRAAVATPMSEGETLRLAREYVAQGRMSGDVATVNLAASLLLPRAEAPMAPGQLLLTLAGCRSFSHEFTNALALLERAAVFPETRAEADLQSVSILITLGRYGEARARLAGNLGLFGDTRGITLVALLASCTGQLRQGYAMLKRENVTKLSPAEARWRLGVLAEMAERLGDDRAAEEQYRRALSLAEPDLCLSAAWLDFLLKEKRNEEALAFIATSPWPERLALWKEVAAPTRGGTAMLEEQFARTTIHRREHALFLLRVKGNAERAAVVAMENWSTQKETADIRLALEAANASGRADLAEQVKSWVAARHFEDARLTELMKGSTL